MTVVVDTSAIVAVLLNEPMASDIEHELATADNAVMCAATYVEASIVIEAKLGAAGWQLFEELIAEAEIEIVELSARAAREAVVGWRTFGKGRHTAALNLGDCYAYGEARHRNAPILCVGEDFRLTTIETLP